MRSLIILLGSILLLTAFFFSFDHFKKAKTQEITELADREGPENPFDDLQKSLQDEENLLKDPHTGKIPEGIHELELMQAREIFRQQSLEAARQSNSAKLTSTTYTYQGPNNLGGRTRAIAFDVSDPTSNTIIAGSVSGGVFKTTNGGTSWTRVSPSNQNYTITAIAQDTRAGHTNTWYYAGGEAIGNSAVEDGAFYLGDGVYKSTDGGNTWTKLPNSNTGSLYSFDQTSDLVTKLAVNPVNGDVYMACLGQIVRSQDGGSTWSGVQSASSFSSSDQVTDVAITSTGIIYTAFSGTANNGNAPAVDGVWSSTTGNSGSFTHIAGTGSPITPSGWNTFGNYGRVVLAIAPSNENLVFAMYWNNLTSDCTTPKIEAGFFEWNQSTGAWTNLSSTLPDEPGCSKGNDPFAVQSGYDMVIAVKPNDANTIIIGGTNVYRSTNGGASWTRIGGYASSSGYALYTNHHSDIHALAFKPSDPTKLVTGDDGGIQVGDITAGTVSWTPLNNNYQTYQYYHVAIKQESGVNDFIGGAQDNGTTTAIGGSSAMTMINSGDGSAVGFGSGTGTYKQYSSQQYGTIYRLQQGAFEADITPSGVSSIFATYFLLDPDNTQYLYYAGQNKLLRITNASTATNSSWQTFAFAFNGNIRSMATTRGAYTTSNRLYIGTDQGKLYRITDPANASVSTTTPVDITPTSMTGGGTLIDIAVNPTNQDEVLAVYSNYGIVNAWYTNNAGNASPTWTNVEGNLSLPSYRAAMILKNGSTTEYYVGTSVGLYKTTLMNGASTVWTQEAASQIGNSLVTSLSLRTADNTFAIGTHGSGMWSASIGGTLPVRFTEFTGSLVNNSSLLKWTTATENNNKGFEIERSYDGISFKKIGFIAGSGNSTVLHNYTFLDKDIAQDDNYYRLRQVDLDGNSTFSGIILINDKLANFSTLKVLQNPFRGYLDLQLPQRQSKQLVIHLYDMGGRVIYNQILSSDQTKLRLNFDGKNFNSGIYILQVSDGSKQYITKVIKQ